jgi:serine O-acetyltransferase
MTDEKLNVWQLILSDIRVCVDTEGRPAWKNAAAMLIKTIFSEKVHAVIRYRISHVFWEWGLTPVAMLIRRRTLSQCGAELHPRARIGPGFCLAHTVGVGIGNDTVIGKNCRVHHGTLVGELGRGSKTPFLQPVIGDNVTIGAHVLVAGPVTVGDQAVIGANSFVIRDVPARAIVGGVPAKFIRWVDPDDLVASPRKLDD